MLKAELMRVEPMPWIGTYRSRGMDIRVIWRTAGTTRASMIVSERWPPAADVPPKALPSVSDRVSLPTMSMVNGLPAPVLDREAMLSFLIRPSWTLM